MIEEMNYFIGLQVKQTNKRIFIDQSKYTRNILNRFGIPDSSTSTPMPNAIKLDLNIGSSKEINRYRDMIGSILYLIASSPDIMYATCLCARFQVDPTPGSAPYPTISSAR